MRLHMILVVGFVLIAAGCAEEQQAASEAMDEAPVTASDAVAAPAGEREVRIDGAWHRVPVHERLSLPVHAQDDRPRGEPTVTT